MSSCNCYRNGKFLKRAIRGVTNSADSAVEQGPESNAFLGSDCLRARSHPDVLLQAQTLLKRLGKTAWCACEAGMRAQPNKIATLELF